MRIVNKNSTQSGGRGQSTNQLVAEQCLADPGLLAEIGECLDSLEARFAGDCAEIMTLVAARRPERVNPYVPALLKLLSHQSTRVRWEAMHSLAYLAEGSPETIAAALPRLSQIIQADQSVIVRDYAVDAVAGYARSGTEAARAAFPVLQMALGAWGGKHARHALDGLANVAGVEPELKAMVRQSAQPYLEDPRPVVRKAAKAALETSG